MAKKGAGVELFALKGSDAIYLALLKKIRSAVGNDAVLVEVKQTCTHLVAEKDGSAFAGVHPRKEAVLLNLKLDAPWESKRVRKTEQVSKNRFHCETLIATTGEIDSELLGKVKQAWRLSVEGAKKKAAAK